ncbi:uroporphyrinogen-III C-methyltransferase [Lacisediminihabitans profunda]|uniref:uroporphyrinogen-III C-methyltransferase n=1 Tax=Lacisediminihabitans profunda TaxID=2594790 RepID=A0A5C8URH4_9MICO|nr:uroporphyrinogen-III C-methyltransferase [Lacisediminihabitans profunda]TXN30067.1 uroporphyrinogen-III C-methyltransferase [Lacisediminihabitans profunda]
MDLTLDLTHRSVLVIGGAHAARRSIARYRAAGAAVHLVTESPAPSAAKAVEWPRSADGWRGLLSTMDLVVLVGATPAIDTTIAALATELRLWLTRERAAATGPVGHVTLVGGGPGDEGLMTVAALRALRDADIVYFDRLGPHDRLADWAPGAEFVDVGKLPGHHAVPQAEIERMIVASALAGQTVVRLKGGDPFVFGRGGEEVLACRVAGVPVSVISGVSSAIAAPAIAGIPVTHRELSRMFTVVSGHAPFTDEQLAHLVGLGGTIVVLMGIGTLPQLSAGLARHGMDAAMPVAIIERAFTDSQRTTVASIGTVVDSSAQAGIRSPAVIVIGEVVRLAHDADVAAVELLDHAARLAR